MKMIPIFRCRNMKEAVSFYTTVLDFELKYPGTSADELVIELKNGEAELQLTSLDGDQRVGTNANVLVQDIDGLFEKYLKRGLDTSSKSESPVHQGPMNQSWGNREFYVTDADGNTLRFFEPIE